MIPNSCKIGRKWNKRRQIKSRFFSVGYSYRGYADLEEKHSIDVEISTVRRAREDVLASARVKSVLTSAILLGAWMIKS
jgi:hypothetical protein